MRNFGKITLIAVAAVTIGSLALWQATGGDWYTKFEVVKQVESEPDANDPLAAAGFYDGQKETKTVVENEFRFGLLPTPAGLLDKHALSVASVNAPVWVLGAGIIWYRRSKRQK